MREKSRLDAQRKFSGPPAPLAALFVAVGFALAGCNDPNANGGLGRGVSRTIWIEPDTGCQYHFWQNGAPALNNYAMALAPRIGSDGKPVCATPHAGEAAR